MLLTPLVSISDTLQVNDWFLSVTILTLLLMLLIMGPYRYAYLDSVSSMFRLKNPDGDISYPLLFNLGYLLIFILSCISIGIAVSVYFHAGSVGNPSGMMTLLWYSVCFRGGLPVRQAVTHNSVQYSPLQ